MSTFGVIFVAYQAADLVAQSLQPWIDARAARLGGHEYVICAVSVPFVGFDHGTEPLDNTIPYLSRGHLDHFITSIEPMTEVAARGAALAWLRDVAKVDVCIQWDADEVPGPTDIGSIVSFIEAFPFVSCFRFSYRNAVFDEHTYLVEPFTPMRAHRIHAPGGYVADSFYDDNNVRYWRPWEREKMSGNPILDVQLANMTIPATVAAPKHLSWLSNLRSRNKIRYQHARWGHCGFRWDEVANELRFDEDYYAKHGLPLPEVIHER